MKFNLYDANGNTLSWDTNPSIRSIIERPDGKICEAFKLGPELTKGLITQEIHEVLSLVSNLLNTAVTKTANTGVNHLQELRDTLERLNLEASDVHFEPTAPVPMEFKRPFHRLPPGH